MHDERYGRKACQRAPKPPFGFWLFYTGDRRGDVRKSYEFAVMQFTRFRPARRRAVSFRFLRAYAQKQTLPPCSHGWLQALLPPDSIVLHRLRRIRNTYRITGVSQTRHSGGFGCAFVFWGTQKPSQRGRCRRMSVEEGMRRKIAREEPTKTAENLAFYASSVSTSAATFPIGEGLDRRILKVARLRLR